MNRSIHLAPRKSFAAFVILFWLGVIQAFGQSPVDFNRDVRPILSDKCFFCHGPDEEDRQADLRLDVEADAKQAAISEGSAEDSDLVARIASADPDVVMPPRHTNKSLSAPEIEILKTWINEGANYQQHWAFAPPVDVKLPMVKGESWPKNPIDYFVLRGIESQQLKPSPEATRRELIRRVTFDLTGLPPTLDEVNSFLNDDQPGAYARVVDRLLASPHFGERMAVNWMDVARFGDSSVMHADGPRDMWPWRDWVINAYNENKPFDKFVVEQIAGDLIPNSTIDQKIASGFNRNHASSDEGGAIPEELRVDYIVDRVKTTTNAFLGLSFECAQCHDHKYDPISQKEYYRFFAFFNNNADPGFQNRSGNQAPIATLLKPDEEKQLRVLRTQFEENEAAIVKPPSEVSAEARDWMEATRSSLDSILIFDQPWLIGPLAGGNPNDIFNQKFFYPTDGRPDTSQRIDSQRWTGQAQWFQGRLEPVEVHTHSAFIVYQQIDSPTARSVTTQAGANRDIDGLKIWVNGELVKSQRKIKKPDEDADFTTQLELDLRAGTNHVFMQMTTGKSFGAARLVLKIDDESVPNSIRDGFQTSNDKSNELLNRYYHRYLSQSAKERSKQRDQIENQIEKLLKGKPSSMIMGDRVGDTRPTYVLFRGNYHQPVTDEIMSPGVPSVLPALPDGAKSNRLALAQWMVDPAHPLTARVAVNRYWSMLFGRGLVGTVLDFGNQGLPPTHPELLDWMARDFIEQGWDIKRTIRQIVTSSTYRQSSRISSALAAKDTENRWLARGPRFRLMGEFIRDQALSVSGLLVDEIGGPSVKPYQPGGLWNEVSLNKGVRFKQDHGEKLYRRSLYTYIKRSAPQPQLTIFDAPTREKCTVQRAQTNTPLAALVPLNEVQFVEASRALGQRVIKQADEKFESRLEMIFELCLARKPSQQEIDICRRIFDQQRASFESDPKAALDYIGHGESKRDESIDPVELATWSVIANMVLNMDEALTRG